MQRCKCPEVFCKKGVLRNFTKVTGKHLYQSPFFNKVAVISFFYRTPLVAASKNGQTHVKNLKVQSLKLVVKVNITFFILGLATIGIVFHSFIECFVVTVSYFVKPLMLGCKKQVTHT